MIRLYGKNGILCHFVHRFDEFNEQRTNLVDDDQFIQCSALRMNEGHTFKPHYHIWKPCDDVSIAQESWVVISGSVKCTFYDLDNTILDEIVLYPGDASFTLFGGHTYTILENYTKVYEYKTGPYTGQLNDKVFI